MVDVLEILLDQVVSAFAAAVADLDWTKADSLVRVALAIKWRAGQ